MQIITDSVMSFKLYKILIKNRVDTLFVKKLPWVTKNYLESSWVFSNPKKKIVSGTNYLYLMLIFILFHRRLYMHASALDAFKTYDKYCFRRFNIKNFDQLKLKNQILWITLCNHVNFIIKIMFFFYILLYQI